MVPSTEMKPHQTRWVVDGNGLVTRRLTFFSSDPSISAAAPRVSLITFPSPIELVKNMIILKERNWTGLPEAMEALLADQKRAETIAENAFRTLRGR